MPASKTCSPERYKEYLVAFVVDESPPPPPTGVFQPGEYDNYADYLYGSCCIDDHLLSGCNRILIAVLSIGVELKLLDLREMRSVIPS